MDNNNIASAIEGAVIVAAAGGVITSFFAYLSLRVKVMMNEELRKGRYEIQRLQDESLAARTRRDEQIKHLTEELVTERTRCDERLKGLETRMNSYSGQKGDKL